LLRGRFSNSIRSLLGYLKDFVSLMPAFVLFTSIRPPSDANALTYLKSCLNSWRIAGFDIVAVNGPTDCDAIASLGLPVELHRVSNDGKPRIGQILSAIRASSSDFAGIINADCRLIAYPNLAVNLRSGLPGAAALAWRLNVDESAIPAAEPYGFDAFFFDAKFIPDDDLGFTIGDPWWDTWFPLALAANKAKVEILAVPLLLHQTHPYNWDKTKWLAGADRGWKALRTWRVSMDPDLFVDIPDDWWSREKLNPHQLAIMSQRIVTQLRRYPPKNNITVLPADLAEVEDMLRLGGYAMIEAAELRRTDVSGSTFWRMTKPLRMAIDAFRGD
jgi:hypothetical protein